MDVQKTTIADAMPHADHQRIADRLTEAGDLLEQQGANPFRVTTYRKAAVSDRTRAPNRETQIAVGTAINDLRPANRDTLQAEITNVLNFRSDLPDGRLAQNRRPLSVSPDTAPQTALRTP
ncbi:MAG: helix-hairpin-helix domain-containing protein [Geminicoccaceae bacterium]